MRKRRNENEMNQFTEYTKPSFVPSEPAFGAKKKIMRVGPFARKITNFFRKKNKSHMAEEPRDLGDYQNLLSLVPPIVFSTLDPKNKHPGNRISPTIYKRAIDCIKSCDICALTVTDEGSSILISAYVHRRLYQHVWQLSRFELEKEGLWTTGKSFCACKSNSQSHCSHSVSLLLLAASLQISDFRFPPFLGKREPKWEEGHPLLMYASMRETTLPWKEKLKLFCSRELEPGIRRKSLLNEKVTMTFQWMKSPPKKRGRKSKAAAAVTSKSMKTTSWAIALQKLPRPRESEPDDPLPSEPSLTVVSEETVESTREEPSPPHDTTIDSPLTDAEATTPLLRRSNRKRPRPLRYQQTEH